MSLRNAIKRREEPLAGQHDGGRWRATSGTLQETRFPFAAPLGREARFRFAVPVLRVRDVAATVAWYKIHLGFEAETFPVSAPFEFAVLERDDVQLLVRCDPGAKNPKPHSGWDLYLWVDGADLSRLEAEFTALGQLARPMSPLGQTACEFEVRDPNGYVLCIGGPTAAPRCPSATPTGLIEA